MANPNPNNFNYWIRNGSVLLPYTLGSVAGTADFDYWRRNGSLEYPAAIQPSSSPTPSGSTLLSLGVG